MTPVQASQAIFARWVALWPGLSGSVPYSVDNLIVPEAATFASVALISLDSEQTTLGPPGRRKWEHTGIIEVRLHGPIAVGRSQLDLLGQHVATIYRGRRFGYAAGEQGITTHATVVAELRRDRDSGNRWILTASTPFEYTEIA